MVRGVHFRPNGIQSGPISYSHRVGGGSDFGWNNHLKSPLDNKQFGRAPKVEEPLSNPVFRPEAATGSIDIHRKNAIPMVQDDSGEWVKSPQTMSALNVWRPGRLGVNSLATKALMLMFLASLAGGCIFDPSGKEPLCVAMGTCDAGVGDAGVTDSSVSDAEVLDGDLPDVAIQVDAALDAETDGGLPVIYSPAISSPAHQSFEHNDGVLAKWDPPQSIPAGMTLQDYEITWTDGTNSFTEHTPLENYPVSINSASSTYSIQVSARFLNAQQQLVYSQPDEITVYTKNTVVTRLEMLEGAGTLIGDSSGYGNHGLLSGCDHLTAWNLSGVTFDGSGCYIDLGNAFAFGQNDSFTVVIRRVSRASIASSQAVVSRWNDASSGTAGGLWLGFMNNGGPLRLLFYSDLAADNGIAAETAAQFLTPNVLYSLAMTRDGSDATAGGIDFFIDNQLEAVVEQPHSISGPVTYNVPSRVGAIVPFGGPITGVDQPHHGIIGGIVTFNEVLDATGLQQVFCYGKGLELHITLDSAQLHPDC